MTARLFLVCHASTVATHAARFPVDEPLDDRGAAQAAAASGSVPRCDQVWCGPEIRCRETASVLGLAAGTDAGLTDLDLGRWRGRTLAEVEQQHPDALATWLTDPGATPHHGESVLDLKTRVAGWLRGLPASGRIVAITHPAVIRAVLLDVLECPAESFWRIDVPPLSATHLTRSGRRWTLRETGHPLVET